MGPALKRSVTPDRKPSIDNSHILLRLAPNSLLWPLLALAALAPAAAAATEPAARAPRMERVAHCSWDRPGHNPFMGEVVPAIDRYTEIPTPVRQRLKERMQARRYDDLVEIRRDSIRGKHDYGSEIRDMHFALDRVCSQVTRRAWTDAMRERGLVYCDSGHCILVPTVCRNVSRIERRSAAAAANESASSAEALAFDPPAVGAPGPAGDGADSFAAGAGSPATALLSDGVASDGGLLGGDDTAPPGSFTSGGAVAGGGLGSSLGGPGGGIPSGRDGSSGGLGVGVELPTVTAPVPEPATWASMVLGLLALTVATRRQRRQGRSGAPRCATQKRS
jgi:PEP-CTERM motif